MSRAINITGSHGNFAGIGHHARGNIAAGAGVELPMAEIGRELARLARLLDENADAVADRTAAAEALVQAEQELRSAEPRPHMLRMALNAVAGAAPGISAVAGAVGALKELASGLW